MRLANTRRLLAQLVGSTSVSMDTWFDYVGLLIGELRPEVERLVETDAELKKSLERFLGEEVADILLRRNPDKT